MQQAHTRPATIEQLAFRGELRRYQRTVVASAGAAMENDRHHIVAPPGSGKTILGLELVRRLSSSAVVFAPTTVIQRQWVEAVERFVPEGADPSGWVTTDPHVDAPIRVFTYQLIATPDAASEALDQMALERWRQDLESGNVGAAGERAAAARIEEIREANPDAWRGELARRRQELRRELLRADPASIDALLHPNARALIDRLARAGVRTIVLDECHHLLDYWAIVLRALAGRFERPRTIGLTATLPDLESPREHENYVGLVGDVDFETPVPAVVREGHLAPYRDLVLFVEPGERERAWIDDVGGELDRAVADVTSSTRFETWVTRTMSGPLDELTARRGALVVAATRWIGDGGSSASAGVPELPAELAGAAAGPPTLGDRIELLGSFMLDVLVPSRDPADHAELARLRTVLRSFGVTVTERGIRRSRTPGDLLLSLSSSRVAGAVRVLRRELEVLGSELRGIVVTDFDRERSGVQVVDDVVGAHAGGARRVAGHIASDDVLGAAGVALVTGRIVAIDEQHAGQVLETCIQVAAADALEVELSLGEPRDGLVELVGTGTDWRPGVWVPLVTAALQAGDVQILVGTRALLGEGWDAPSANVLVDLTSVASPQAVQQLRGRTLRIDPQRPHKVAHNWDIVCVDNRTDAGDPDLKRFLRRHEHLWGLVPPVDAGAAASTVAGLMAKRVPQSTSGRLARMMRERAGMVESGIVHVDPMLAIELALLPSWTDARLDAASRRSLEAAGARDEHRALWKVGSPFDDEIRSGTRLAPPAVAPVTAATVRRIGSFLVAALVAALGLALQIAGSFVGQAAEAWSGPELLLGFAGVFIVVLALGMLGPLRDLVQLVRRGAPADAVLVDAARATFDAMRASGLLGPEISDSALRIADRGPEVRVWLEGVPVVNAQEFATALRELFDEVRDQRWLIARTDGRVPWWLGPGIGWLLARIAHRGSPPAHATWMAVPRVLARSGRRRESFAEAWANRVGGGRIVDARSVEGAVALAHARATTDAARGRAAAWRSWA